MGDELANILVVDDLPEKLLAYRTILSDLGQNIITARSGEEALRAVLRHDFAVILLDVQMPGMSGLETASLIRKRKRSAHTPIIFLTAFADEVRVAEGYAQGAVDYITTPVVPGILQAKVRVFSDLYRMTQQVRRQAEERIALAEERTKREAAEEANRRLRFLTRAGEVIGQSLDQEVTVREVVRLPVPLLADATALVILQGEGRQTRWIHARTGTDGPTVEDGPGNSPIDQELAEAIDRTFASGTTSTDPGRVIAIPLRTRGRTFAVLSLSRSLSGRTFTAADITVAEMFTSRAASALENARLYHEVQQADRQKNEFLSMLAHELRNPLAPIRNANEVLRQKATEPTRIRWAQGVIDRQLTHLVRLVDDLLDVSRLTQGKIRLATESITLDAVVAQAVEASRPVIDQFRHELEVNLPLQPIRMTADKARLTQVLTNLLNNAAKYTDPGGRIWLTALRGTPSPGFVEIRIRDTGVGISADLLPTVFNLFTQASRSLDRSQGGLGVGLTLVRRLVEMHGGSVEAHSEGSMRGSEFVVRLPITPEAPETVPTETTADNLNGEHSSSDALRIVVVDDNVDCAESLASLVGLLGNQVRVVHDGPTALVAVREFEPDVVLLDIGLPGMDGYEIARRLRGEVGSQAALVAISGYGREEDRSMAREAGFDQHFVKPVEFAPLRAVLDSIRARRVGS